MMVRTSRLNEWRLSGQVVCTQWIVFKPLLLSVSAADSLFRSMLCVADSHCCQSRPWYMEREFDSVDCTLLKRALLVAGTLKGRSVVRGPGTGAICCSISGVI